jgi:hypothetical protein
MVMVVEVCVIAQAPLMIMVKSVIQKVFHKSYGIKREKIDMGLGMLNLNLTHFESGALLNWHVERNTLIRGIMSCWNSY